MTDQHNDSSDEFKTLCAYARNYIEERGDKEEVDNLERVIASLSQRLALDADPTSGARQRRWYACQKAGTPKLPSVFCTTKD